MRFLLLALLTLSGLAQDFLTPPIPQPVRQMFTYERTETFVSDLPGSQSVVRAVSVFTGFSTPVGVRGDFNRIKFYIYAWDATLVPTRVRARIRETDYQGTILGEAVVNVSPTVGVAYLVTVDFASTISSSLPLWLGVFTDGHTGEIEVPNTDYPMSSFPQARYSTDGNVTTPATSTQFIPNYPATGAAQSAQYCAFYLLSNPLKAVLSDAFKSRLNADSVLGDLFTFQYQFATTNTSGSANGAVWANETASFSGWGSLVGIQSNSWSAVSFPVRAWDSNAPVSLLRTRIRLTDDAGAIIADKTQSFAPDIGVATTTTVDFGTAFDTGQTNLWLEYFTDGHAGMYSLASVAYPSPPSRRYWINRDVVTPGTGTDAVAAGGSQLNLFVAFGAATKSVQNVKPKKLLTDALQITSPSSATPTVQIQLPDKLYAVEGIEFNVYFKNILRASVGLDQLQLDVVCSKPTAGASVVEGQFDRFWRFTPVAADAGNVSWTLNVYYGGSLVATKACTLVIKAKTVGGGNTRKCLFIGDSTTIDGRVIAEAQRVDADAALDSNFTINFVGSKTFSNSAQDSAGGTQSPHCEAISGWSLNLFYTDAASPFVTNGVFSANYYLTNNSITLAANDWVFVHLGINDTLSYTDDVNLTAKIAVMLTQLDGMITSFKAAQSSIRFGILTTMPATGQDGFGKNYSSGQTSWRFARNRGIWTENVLSHYDKRQAESIYVFPYGASLDTDYNCTVLIGGGMTGNFQTITQNALQPWLTFQVTWNGVHPSCFGYWQEGQQVYVYLKAQEN
jgi:hypothetical protein